MKDKLMQLLKQNTFRVIFYAFLVVFILYIVLFSLTGFFSSSEISSSIAETFTYYQTVSGYGIAIRDEALLSTNASSSFHYLVEDGDRVAVGSHVASYYNKPVGDDLLYEISRLTHQKDQLTSALSAETVMDIVSISNDIEENVLSYISLAADDNFNDAVVKASDLQILFSKLDIRKKGSSYYENALVRVTNELNTLISSNGLKTGYIDSLNAGYFSSVYDGYEYLTTEQYSAVTVSSFNELMSLEPLPKVSGYVGKTQDSPTWYYICLFNTADIGELYVGKSVTLEFDLPEVGTKQIGFIVSYISVDNAGETVVSFRCTNVTSYEFLIRKTSANLVLRSYKGLRIPTEAICVEDGQQGVYVLVGRRIVFKPIDVLYTYEEDGSFAVVTAKNSVGSRVLQENDEVITGGKDLFDGKVIYVN